MDNNAFEKEMIKKVNENADATASAMNAIFEDAVDKWKKRRKAQRILAVTESVFWVLGLATIGVAMSILNRLGVAPDGLAVAITAVFGFVTGIRVSGLVRTI